MDKRPSHERISSWFTSVTTHSTRIADVLAADTQKLVASQGLESG